MMRCLHNKNQIIIKRLFIIMLRQERRAALIKAISKGQSQFRQFEFQQDNSSLNDDDIILMKQIGFPQTEVINFQNNELTSASIKILCEAYPQAMQIQISNNQIGDESIEFISKLMQLRRIKLRNLLLTQNGMKYFARIEMNNLMEVHLNQNKIGNKGCQWISSAGWRYLKEIYLTNCNIEDAGAMHLSKTDWKDFTTLYLMDNRITCGGVKELKRADWKKLKTFSIHNNQFRWWFRMIEFYPHAFDPKCNFSFRRLKSQRMMMNVSSRYDRYIPYD